MTRKVIDWESVEVQYRAGVRSLKDIGREFDVSDAAIVKRAKRDGWSRDLRAKIQAKADAKVSEALVSARVSAQTKSRERDVIEANASVIADALLIQREDVRRGRTLVMSLFEELEHETAHRDLYQQLGELMQSGDESGTDKLNEIYRKVIAFPSRVDSAKKLAESLRTLVELERKVLRIKDDTNLDDFAKKIGEGAALSGMDAYRQMCNGG